MLVCLTRALWRGRIGAVAFAGSRAVVPWRASRLALHETQRPQCHARKPSSDRSLAAAGGRRGGGYHSEQRGAVGAAACRHLHRPLVLAQGGGNHGVHVVVLRRLFPPAAPSDAGTDRDAADDGGPLGPVPAVGAVALSVAVVLCGTATEPVDQLSLAARLRPVGR